LLSVLGPGLMVCLADSDIGGLSTMAMAGSETGYTLVSMQFVLIPALYLVQEMVVRLALCRGCGIVALVREEMGEAAAVLLAMAMCIVGLFAIVSEFSGIVAVGELFGVRLLPSCVLAAVFLILVVRVSSYRKIELAGLSLGACLGIFLVAAAMCKPPWARVADAVLTSHQDLWHGSARVKELAVANVGTVVTPWMLFFQGSALVEKRLGPADLAAARLDTAVGSVVTQLIMAAVLLIFAVRAPGLDTEHLSLAEVFLAPLRSLLGQELSRVLLAFGLLGSSLLATLVVSLGIAWNVAECWFKEKTVTTALLSDADRVTGSHQFQLLFAGTVVVAAAAVLVSSFWVSIAEMNVLIQVLNGVAMPPIVGCIFLLATSKRVLPEEFRVQGLRAQMLGAIIALCSFLAVLMGVESMRG